MEDKKTIKELIKLIEDSDLTEIEYENESFRIKLARNDHANFLPRVSPQTIETPVVQTVSAATETRVKEIDYAQHAGVIKSPMVGVVYLAPEPGAPTYVKEGDNVTAEQTLFLVEAMKTFNPVKAPRSGKVIKILVADNMPVEYGEPLLVLE